MTTTPTPPQLRDVTLRDGLQLAGKLLSVEQKVHAVRTLLDVGVPYVEIGSITRPDLVPSMANTIELLHALEDDELERCHVWVATPGGARRALEAGARNLQYCLSVSTSHNQANLGRSTETSLDTLPVAVALAHDAGAMIQLCLATSFTCPFEGRVEPDRVVEIACDERASGTREIVICDTLGQAHPAEVRSLVARVRNEAPPRPIVFHGHDTWGMGVANSIAAVEGGAMTIDGALGGLGGCPFAPGASGNTSSEDLLFAFRPPWLDPGALHRLVQLSESVLGTIGEDNRSRTAEGVHSESVVFPWVLPPA